MSESYKKRAVMQDVENPPVIEDRKKRRMGKGKARARRIAGKLEYMPEGEATHAEGEELMIPAPAEGAPSMDMRSLPEMEPAKAKAAERYLRMRVRVRGDQVEVVGAWSVDGPLVSPEKLHAGLAYEVAVGDKQVAMGSIPDAGVRRSFPPPEPGGEMKGHHIEELPSYEFPVRIPQQDVSARSFPMMRITVYRIKGEVPEEPVSGAPLARQYAETLRPVAELKGIRLKDLPDDVQEQLKKALER